VCLANVPKCVSPVDVAPCHYAQRTVANRLQVTENSFMQYGYLKNFSPALIPLLIKDIQNQTISKAYI
jgi:hypothetical protein